MNGYFIIGAVVIGALVLRQSKVAKTIDKGPALDGVLNSVVRGAQPLGGNGTPADFTNIGSLPNVPKLSAVQGNTLGGSIRKSVIGGSNGDSLGKGLAPGELQ